MTRAAKITYCAALLVGLSIGAYLGFQHAAYALEAYHSSMQLEAPMVLDHFSYLQYSYAGSERAKATLQTSANLLEEIEKSNPEKSQEQDLAVIYTRLALLEDASDESQQSHALMTKAQSWYAASGRNYSESEIKEMLKTKDEYLQP